MKGREEKSREQEVKQEEEQEYIGGAATAVRGTRVASSNFIVSCLCCLTRSIYSTSITLKAADAADTAEANKCSVVTSFQNYATQSLIFEQWQR